MYKKILIPLGVLIYLVVTILGANRIYNFQDLVIDADKENFPPLDVIVCVSGGRGRIEKASQLWLSYYHLFEEEKIPNIPVLFFSGVGSVFHEGNLPPQMDEEVKALLLTRKKFLVVENQSQNTIENAEEFVKSMQNMEREDKNFSWNKIVLVTSGYHIKRAYSVFQSKISKIKNKTAVTPFFLKAIPVDQEPFRKNRWLWDLNGIQVTVTEYFKWLAHQLFYREGKISSS